MLHHSPINAPGTASPVAPRTARRRRGFAGLAAVAAATLLLVGCAGAASSDTGAGSGSGAPDAPLLPAAEGTTEYPLTLDTPFGETVLEQRPERIAIVTASTIDTDALIALGGTPVFAPSTVERNAWISPETIEGIETLWDSEAGAEVSAEQVAASDPDLIVALYATDAVDRTRFKQLSAIAPVLYAESDSLSWQQTTAELGAALDLSQAATDAVDAAEDAVTSARAEHPEFAGKTATHVIVYEEEYGVAYASAPGTDTAALFEQLGFALPEPAARFVDNDVVSGELISLIDAGFLLVSTFDAGTETYVTESPLFTAVPAVAEGRAVFDAADPDTGTNAFAWGLNVQSALSVPWLIDRLTGFAEQAVS
ncbi:ABC transporter substrate-binding protein [Leucobacter musarum]|uniref:ABC transporter substrate-binding protein n=1 Tax=Leucobacter musarum TaxID=1930747 RepID=UPI0006A788A2|nr:ABC transporter substrate-binding protein [Leucobacter musarum]